MKYIALIYSTPNAGPQPGDAEFGAYMEAYGAVDAAMREAGAYLGGEALEGPETATSLRIKGGKVETMDGPFAETKEVLGGFYLMECTDLDEAISLAAKIPTAEHGTIEIRPIMDLSGLME